MKGAQNKQQKTRNCIEKEGFFPFSSCLELHTGFWLLFLHFQHLCGMEKGMEFCVVVTSSSRLQSFNSPRKYFSFCLPTSLELCFSLSRLYSFVSSRLLNNLVYLDFKSRFSLIVLVHLCQVCSSSRVFILIDMAFLNLITLWSIDELKIRSLDETNYKTMKFRWTNTLKSRWTKSLKSR